MEQYVQFLKENAIFYISGQALAEAGQMYKVHQPVIAPWAFPTWSHYSRGVNAKALAFISGATSNETSVPTCSITQAIKISNREIISHCINMSYYHATTPA